MNTDWVKPYLDKVGVGYYIEYPDDYITDKVAYTPSKLYKYCSPTDEYINDFEKDLVYMQHPSDFNDPFDCYLGMSEDQLYEMFFIAAIKIKGWYNGLIKKAIEDNQDIIFKEIINLPIFFTKKYKHIREVMDEVCGSTQGIINNKLSEIMTVTCFSEKNDVPLMWAHYAEKHKGFCIEFDIPKDRTGYPDFDKNHSALLPVIYSDNRPDLTDTILTSDYIATLESSNEINGEILYSLLHKSKNWEYEKEWRIICTNNEKTLHIPLISAIYLGVNTKYDVKKQLVEIARKKNVPVYQMKLSATEYKFDEPVLIK